ncbi:hypothetical protein D3C71_1501430 [compost metagenome]|jgi:hypothetical protein
MVSGCKVSSVDASGLALAGVEGAEVEEAGDAGCASAVLVVKTTATAATTRKIAPNRGSETLRKEMGANI